MLEVQWTFHTAKRVKQHIKSWKEEDQCARCLQRSASNIEALAKKIKTKKDPCRTSPKIGTKFSEFNEGFQARRRLTSCCQRSTPDFILKVHFKGLKMDDFTKILSNFMLPKLTSSPFKLLISYFSKILIFFSFR